MRGGSIAAAGVAALFAATEAAPAAEASAPKAAPAPPAASAPAPAPAAPYEPQLLRLAEMMGALAFLRDLCGEGDGASFRAKMGAFVNADGVSKSQRDLLTGAYNKGFQDYETTYRACTPNALVMSRYLSETTKLAAELAGRYGG